MLKISISFFKKSYFWGQKVIYAGLVTQMCYTKQNENNKNKKWLNGEGRDCFSDYFWYNSGMIPVSTISETEVTHHCLSYGNNLA